MASSSFGKSCWLISLAPLLLPLLPLAMVDVIDHLLLFLLLNESFVSDPVELAFIRPLFAMLFELFELREEEKAGVGQDARLFDEFTLPDACCCVEEEDPLTTAAIVNGYWAPSPLLLFAFELLLLTASGLPPLVLAIE